MDTHHEVTVEVRDQYGAATYHPACEKSKTFAAIAGTKTITEQNIRRIISLGYKVKTLQRKHEFIEGEMK